ncbi:hypothetical protein GGR22_002665, partial [Flavobacterium gossypii]|nr:hypothetical protein [Flavobacterium gossypii]
MKKFLIIGLLVIFSNYVSAQEPNDCVNAITVCGNGNFTSNAEGIGNTQEVSGCGGLEHNSIWLKINIVQSGTLGFNLKPLDTDINVDYDFWVFGPNRPCSNLGSPIRCATTNPGEAGLTSNHTGMYGSTTATQAGPGASGNGYVRWLNVVAGQSYYIAIDRPEGDGGFELEWIGSAMLNGGAFPTPPQANAIGERRTCSITPNVGIFDLNTYRDLINPDRTNNTITFHTTLANAIDKILPLPDIISNTSNPQQIFARVTNNASQCYSITDFSLRVYPVPNATITASPSSACLGQEVTFTINGIPNAVIDYRINAGTVQSVTLDASGTYIFSGPLTATTTYTLVEGRIVGSDNTVICSQSLSNGATVTENVITAQITTSDTPICEGMGMTIDVQGTPGAIVTYTDPSGTQQTLTLDAAGAGTIAIAASLAPGTYTYTLVKASTASTPPCEQNVSDSVTITVVPLPTATITRIDAQVCLGSQSRIRINGQPLAHVDYTLNGTPQPQIQIDATGEYILLETLPAAGTYDYELVRVISDAAPFCTQPLSETITVTVIAAPSATISTASPVICEGGSATVDFSGTLDADV